MKSANQMLAKNTAFFAEKKLKKKTLRIKTL